jgi:hypothetical protein
MVQYRQIHWGFRWVTDEVPLMWTFDDFDRLFGDAVFYTVIGVF